VYSSWLSQRGYQVHLIDPVPLHREQAMADGRFTVAAGLRLTDLLPIEGPLHWAPGIRDRLADPGERQLILDTLAAIEHDPAIAGATAHLHAAGRHA